MLKDTWTLTPMLLILSGLWGNRPCSTFLKVMGNPWVGRIGFDSCQVAFVE